jgi:hypothetical protein
VAGNLALDKFDKTIDDLHKFETIRYGEHIATHGKRSEIGLVRNPAPAKHREPRYELALDELDELAHLLYQTSDINPKYFTGMLMKPDAMRYLNEHNRTPPLI